MQYQTFTQEDQPEYPIAILAAKLDQAGMHREYLVPGVLDPKEVIAYQLHQTGKKTAKAVQKEFLDELMPVLAELGTKYVVCADSEYFKTLTGVAKSDAYLGYVVPNAYPEHMAGAFQVLFIPNYRQVVYNPGPVRDKIQQAMNALWNFRNGAYQDPGCEIIRFAAYPEDPESIESWLNRLLDRDEDLHADIEAFSLKHYSAGIGTVSFSWSKHEGIAFPVDLSSDPVRVRRALKKFFIAYRETGRKMIWHNISYDVTVLIYQLFMKDLLDYEGLLYGLEIMLENWDDTKLIAYLATNTCAGNHLGLKDLSQEFSGNYAVEEIKDITKIPLDELLQYNLIDTLSTCYVKGKYWDQMVADQQEELYETLFKPAIVDIIQMQLTGMPLNMEEVLKTEEVMLDIRSKALKEIQQHKYVRELVYELDQEHVDKRNSELKKKRIKLGDEPQEYNPNSGPQTQRLFYEILELPVLERTDTKQPSTSAAVLEKLKAYTEDDSVKELINSLLDFAAVDKILGTFISAFKEAQLGPDGWHYLFGNFNLGGTVSGRLSSSGPNLQNIPSNGTSALKKKLAKLIKGCFQAPPGSLMIGLDFSSLEDRISALTTKDKNKLKVYLDGYDGHCLRAFSYFREDMPDIEDTVESINSIDAKYKSQRQEGKTPTFLLTYGGTFIGMMAKCGFSKEKAMQIEARYHELYKESDQWVSDRLDEACKVGFVTVAFGLRVRTPLLHQVVRNNGLTPYEAEAEGRTAGNALGQSWGLLNTRASVEFLGKVRASEYRLKIRPIAHIHDAQYFIIPDDIAVLMYVNEHLVKAVQWQDHPAIWHDKVKLGGEVSIFYPTWANDIEIPNGASEDQIRQIVADNTAPQKERAA